VSNYCNKCGGPLIEGLSHVKEVCMSWTANKNAIPDEGCRDLYQADQAGSFFCGDCGWSPLATWSHQDCEINQLEHAGDLHFETRGKVINDAG
jgi:hypothetical protein